MVDERLEKFRKLVDEKFLEYNKNCATEEESRRYMAGQEYRDEVEAQYRNVLNGRDLAATASSCAYCLYMLFE